MSHEDFWENVVVSPVNFAELKLADDQKDEQLNKEIAKYASEQWGFAVGSVPSRIKMQIRDILKLETGHFRTGDLLLDRKLIESEKKERYAEDSQHEGKRYLEYVRNREPNNMNLAQNEEEILTLLEGKPYISAIESMDGVLEMDAELDVEPDIHDACQRAQCVILRHVKKPSDEKVEWLYLAFESISALHKFERMGPQMSRDNVLYQKVVENRKAFKVIFCVGGEHLMMGHLLPRSSKGDDDSIEKLSTYNQMIAQENERMLAIVLEHAVFLRPSDIHFMPSVLSSSTYPVIKFRINGRLHEISTESKFQFNYDEYDAFIKHFASKTKQVGSHGESVKQSGSGDAFNYLSEKKVMMKLRCEFTHKGRPGRSGEDQVSLTCRVFHDAQTFNKSFEDLQFHEGVIKNCRDIGNLRNGLVLVVGGTGSGKSTTISAVINEEVTSSRGSKKFVTLEDPVEQEQENVQQHQISKLQIKRIADGEMTLSEAIQQNLKSFLRADFDTAFIGEIRDEGTAYLAADIAVSGHKAYATYHADSGDSGMLRISSLFEGSVAKEIMFIQAVQYVLYQELVDGVCESCAKPAPITEDELHILDLRYNFTKTQREMLKDLDSVHCALPEYSGPEHTCSKCKDGLDVSRIPIITINKIGPVERQEMMSTSNTRYTTAFGKPVEDLRNQLIELIKNRKVSVRRLVQ